MTRIGPRLKSLMDGVEERGVLASTDMFPMIAATAEGAETGETLPLIVQRTPSARMDGEHWPEYKERIGAALEPLRQIYTDGEGQPLYLANAIAGQFSLLQVEGLADREDVALIELDQLFDATMMDDVIGDVGIAGFAQNHHGLTGQGVRLAVLDSGVDTQHPFLNVLDSISTCGEDIAIPGSHGTHCAGSVASRDASFPGIAPDVDLLNIKVLKHDGRGNHNMINQGVDKALDMDADILSMSIGFNHLPRWSRGGHGWSCPDGLCPLCTAVDNAVAFGKIVCVAAGNEHTRAETLRSFGDGDKFDTELGCPGQSRSAITVGALTKRTFLPASFSSHGPTSYGDPKPDISGPGVNVISTVPAPRNPNGTLVANPSRADLFDRKSGTSMATPIVAGAVALIVQARRAAGLSVSPADIRQALLADAVTALLSPAPLVVGAGRIELATFP